MRFSDDFGCSLETVMNAKKSEKVKTKCFFDQYIIKADKQNKNPAIYDATNTHICRNAIKKMTNAIKGARYIAFLHMILCSYLWCHL